MGRPAACALTSLSTSPHAWARSSGSVDQARLLDRLVDLRHIELRPVGVVLRVDGSARRTGRRASPAGPGSPGATPTFGQTSGCCSGTLQNRVYMIVWSTGRKVTLKPRSSSWPLNTSAVSFPGGMLSPTIVISQSAPSHLPLSKPAFFMYSAASSGSPFGLARKSRSGPLETAGLLEPRESRRDVVRRDRADQRAAARVAQRLAIGVRDHRLADVDVVERRLLRVQGDVAVARRVAAAGAAPVPRPRPPPSARFFGGGKSPLMLASP